MSCNLTPYTGLDPNDQTLTAEQKLQACVAFRGWEMNTFVPEMNSLLPRICDISGVAISAGYEGIAVPFDVIHALSGVPPSRLYNRGDVVAWGNNYYRCVLDGSPALINSDGTFADGSGVAGSPGGTTWNYSWVKLPVVPYVEYDKPISSVTAQANQTIRAATHTVTEDGVYFITASATPSSVSTSAYRYYSTPIGGIYSYNASFNGSAVSGVANLSAGNEIYLDVVGASSGTNVLHTGRITAIRIA